MKRYIKADITGLNEENYDALRRIAHDPCTSPRVLAKLSKYPNIREAVARNSNTSPDVLMEIARVAVDERRVGLLDGLANNPSTPLGILQYIFPCCDFWTHRAIINHPNVGYSALRAMIKSGRLSPGNCKLAKERLKTME